MSETPRTDKATYIYNVHNKSYEAINPYFSRQLERELAKANARLKKATELLRTCKNDFMSHGFFVGDIEQFLQEIEEEQDEL